MKDYRVYCEWVCPVYKHHREICLDDLTEVQAQQLMEMLKHCMSGKNKFKASSYLEREVESVG